MRNKVNLSVSISLEAVERVEYIAKRETDNRFSPALERLIRRGYAWTREKEEQHAKKALAQMRADAGIGDEGEFVPTKSIGLNGGPPEP